MQLNSFPHTCGFFVKGLSCLKSIIPQASAQLLYIFRTVMLLSGLNLLGSHKHLPSAQNAFQKKGTQTKQTQESHKPPQSLQIPLSFWLMVERPSKVRCSKCLILIGLYFSRMTLDKLSPAKGLFMVKSVPEITKRIQRLHPTTRPPLWTAGLIQHCVLAFAALQHWKGRGLPAGKQRCPVLHTGCCLAQQHRPQRAVTTASSCVGWQ